MHGDPNKAGVIGNLLKEVDALVAFRMGPNVLRMKKKICICYRKYAKC